MSLTIASLTHLVTHRDIFTHLPLHNIYPIIKCTHCRHSYCLDDSLLSCLPAQNCTHIHTEAHLHTTIQIYLEQWRQFICPPLFSFFDWWFYLNFHYFPLIWFLLQFFIGIFIILYSFVDFYSNLYCFLNLFMPIFLYSRLNYCYYYPIYSYYFIAISLIL